MHDEFSLFDPNSDWSTLPVPERLNLLTLWRSKFFQLLQVNPFEDEHRIPPLLRAKKTLRGCSDKEDAVCSALDAYSLLIEGLHQYNSVFDRQAAIHLILPSSHSHSLSCFLEVSHLAHCLLHTAIVRDYDDRHLLHQQADQIFMQQPKWAERGETLDRSNGDGAMESFRPVPPAFSLRGGTSLHLSHGALNLPFPEQLVEMIVLQP
mmetsp:Transcript_31058/g.99653  ORF Transcript_31058/g.99653 Transcript_31058/m.99653 type:complete len:207 (+) Transcript_31058:621-1241(+)